MCLVPVQPESYHRGFRHSFFRRSWRNLRRTLAQEETKQRPMSQVQACSMVRQKPAKCSPCAKQQDVRHHHQGIDHAKVPKQDLTPPSAGCPLWFPSKTTTRGSLNKTQLTVPTRLPHFAENPCAGCAKDTEGHKGGLKGAGGSSMASGRDDFEKSDVNGPLAWSLKLSATPCPLGMWTLKGCVRLGSCTYPGMCRNGGSRNMGGFHPNSKPEVPSKTDSHGE